VFLPELFESASFYDAHGELGSHNENMKSSCLLREFGVPEHLLDVAKIRASFEHQRRHGVPTIPGPE
jgi:hypothetical protein